MNVLKNMRVKIWPLKENREKDFTYAQELVDFYSSGPEMVRKDNLSVNAGTTTHKHLSGKHWFLFHEDAPHLFIRPQFLKTKDGLEEHTGTYHIWATCSPESPNRHILASLHPEHYTPETGYGITSEDQIKADQERAFINSPLFEKLYTRDVLALDKRPEPGDIFPVWVGGQKYDTFIDPTRVHRFVPNMLLKHLAGNGGYNIVQLEQDYLQGKFSRREFLEFLMGIGIPIHELASMLVFQNLEFIIPEF